MPFSCDVLVACAAWHEDPHVKSVPLLQALVSGETLYQREVLQAALSSACLCPCGARTCWLCLSRHVLSGSKEFFKIEEASGKRNPKDVEEILRGIDPEKPELADMWEATYAPFGTAKIKIHAVHLAASLGSVEVLQWLRTLACKQWPCSYNLGQAILPILPLFLA